MLWIIPAVLNSTVGLCFTLLAASLGEAISEKSGVYNLGLEGYMLFGAFFGYYGSLISGNVWVGVLFAMMAGLLLSLIHAFISITLNMNQIISGLALWFLGMGVTSYLSRIVGTASVDSFAKLDLGPLSDIPLFGEMLFHHNIMVYIGFALVAVFSLLDRKTPYGLINRATGDNPLAVNMVGIGVKRIRYISVLICGVMSGLAGSYLSLGILGSFSENMTAGKGFIALCVVILGKWDPKKVMLGALLFTMCDAAQMRIQATGAASLYPFLIMSPYVITLLVMLIPTRKNAPPLTLGLSYREDED